MTRLERIRAALASKQPLMQVLTRKDVAWLVETVEIFRKGLEACECSSWPCPACDGTKCTRCQALARLEEPDA